MFGENALPNTFYGKSDKGWMDSEAFAKWFEKFCKDVKERPLLLIYYGHMTHVTIPVITLAMKENVFLIKLPAHCTDLLQVLDKTCFSSLKKSWEQLLGERTNIHGVNYSLSRSEFVNLLCSIWKKGLNENNIKKGQLQYLYEHKLSNRRLLNAKNVFIKSVRHFVSDKISPKKNKFFYLSILRFSSNIIMLKQYLLRTVLYSCKIEF